ncbi:MAG: penicillin-binding protein 2 [Candidatus Omnitrophota bacterium]
MRTKTVIWGIFFIFAALATGLLNLQVIHGKSYRALSDKNCIRLLPQLGARGRIVDTTGEVIVDNKLAYDALYIPQTGGIEQTIANVSSVLGISPAELKNIIRKNMAGPSVAVVLAKDIGLKKAIALEEIKIDSPGIMVQQRPVRHYPYESLGCHVFGYVNEIDRWRLTKLSDYGYKTKDLVGFGGIEEKYDYYLREEEGGVSFLVDHVGRFVRLLGYREAVSGKDVQLTLNLKAQKIIEDNLKGHKGSVIVLEPYSGAIVAMASYPDFSPSSFTEHRTAEISRVVRDADSPLLNRAISGIYPAGSVFKIIVSCAGLETKKINLNTSFSCAGGTYIGKQEFSCWDTHGQQSLIPAIAHSCNVFFYKTGIMLGSGTIHDYAVKFGLSRPVPLELPYEASGFVPSAVWRRIYKFKSWYAGDTANLSIGQGDLLVTPLQMARMISVFANGGNLVAPYIVKEVEGKTFNRAKRPVSLGLKETTIEYIREGLRLAVSDPKGTASVLSGLPLQAAGKTGTAQAPPGQTHAWFAGFFPFQKPKYVLCVFLERGGPGYAASVIARHIIEAFIQEGLL